MEPATVHRARGLRRVRRVASRCVEVACDRVFHPVGAWTTTTDSPPRRKYRDDVTTRCGGYYWSGHGRTVAGADRCVGQPRCRYRDSCSCARAQFALAELLAQPGFLQSQHHVTAELPAGSDRRRDWSRRAQRAGTSVLMGPHRSTRTGSVSQPLTVEVGASLARSESTSQRGNRFSTSSSAIRPSRRARAAPRQKWMP
jgi:hypothetical protein